MFWAQQIEMERFTPDLLHYTQAMRPIFFVIPFLKNVMGVVQNFWPFVERKHAWIFWQPPLREMLWDMMNRKQSMQKRNAFEFFGNCRCGKYYGDRSIGLYACNRDYPTHHFAFSI